MKIYISGPVTGVPDDNRAAFADAARQLRAVGHDVVNPHELGIPPGTSWSDAMRPCIRALTACDAVAVLPFSGLSRGTRWELLLAVEVLGVPVQPPEYWLYNRQG
jgi:hypothetical protein